MEEGTTIDPTNASDKTWSLTEHTGRMTKRVSVREISNGFIVRQEEYGHKNDSDESWVSEESETYYKENPFAGKKGDEPKEKENETLSSLSTMFNSLDKM